MGQGLRVELSDPKATETSGRLESDFRVPVVLQPSRGDCKTPGNLRFTAPLEKGKYGVGKPTGAASEIRNLGVQPRFPPPVPLPQASISPTHAAAQHKKTISDQRVKPCWKNRPTLKLWRESPDSERKSPAIPPPHHQGFWRKARKYSGESKPAKG